MTLERGMEEHMLFLSSDDSRVTHPQNKPTSFVTELPRPLHLKGFWVCSLREFHLTTDTIHDDYFYVCSNICEDSIVGETLQPVLRRIPVKSPLTFAFYDTFHFKVSKSDLQRIEISIRDSAFKKIDISTGTVLCTLHLQRVY